MTRQNSPELSSICRSHKWNLYFPFQFTQACVLRYLTNVKWSESTLALSQHGSSLTCLRTFEIPNISLAVCLEPQTSTYLVLVGFNQDNFFFVLFCFLLLFWIPIMLAFTVTYSSGLNYNFFSTPVEQWHHCTLKFWLLFDAVII